MSFSSKMAPFYYAELTRTSHAEEVAPGDADHSVVEKLERFSTAVREIFARAEERARELSSKYVGTGHVLLALVEKAPNTATDILDGLGINLTELLSSVKLSVDTEQPSDLSRIALDNNVKKVIELSVEEARRLSSQQVLPEHLLIGMLREDCGQAGKILRGQGVSIEGTYAELVRLHNQGGVSKQTRENLTAQEPGFWQAENTASPDSAVADSEAGTSKRWWEFWR